MKLDAIRLVNFKQFAGQQEAIFSTDDECNVTVFHGANGTGKTSLFTAINWCLYEKGAEDSGELVCREALSNVDVGASVETSVSVWFSHEEHDYLAKRTLRKMKLEIGTRQVDRPVFTLGEILPSGSYEIIDNPSNKINSILPEKVRQYFFFDGEKMEGLTKADNDNIKEAVRNIMRLAVIERTADHLKSIAQDYLSALNKEGSSKVSELVTREQTLRSLRDKKIEEKLRIEIELKSIKKQLEDIEELLRGFSDTKVLQQRRDGLKDKENGVLLRIDEVRKAIQNTVNLLYPVFLQTKVLSALEILDQKRSRGVIPSGIREQLIHDLLKQKVCICGRSFVDSDEAFMRLSALVKSSVPRVLEDLVLNMTSDLRQVSRQTSLRLQDLDKVCKEHARYLDDIQKIRKELDEISKSIKDISLDEIADKERLKSKYQRDLETYNQNLGSITREITLYESQILKCITEREKEEIKDKKVRIIAKKENLARRSYEAVLSFNELFIEKARRDIEEATKEVFRNLAWKHDYFTDLTLTRDFTLEVMDKWGNPARRELSAGERQVLSLSFICAMAKVSGETAPLVMDTPFGRLSGAHLESVAKALPGMSSQLILFVTDKEWNEVTRVNLESKIGLQYSLEFDDKIGCTTVKEL